MDSTKIELNDAEKQTLRVAEQAYAAAQDVFEDISMSGLKALADSDQCPHCVINQAALLGFIRGMTATLRALRVTTGAVFTPAMVEAAMNGEWDYAATYNATNGASSNVQ